MRAEKTTANMKALLIIPEPATQEKVQVFLAGEGFDCCLAESFARARDLLEISRPLDLVIVSIDSPEDVGHDILIYLRNNERLAHIPVIICGASTPEAPVEASGPVGGVHLLKKPIDDRELADLTGKIVGSKNGRILLVDDEVMVRDVIRATLEHDGNCVFEAENGIVALGVLASENIDMVISDMRMPEMSGRELLAKVRMQYPDMPFYLISGCSLGSIDQELVRAGASGLLAKPFRYADIIELVRRGLSMRRTIVSKGAK